MDKSSIQPNDDDFASKDAELAALLEYFSDRLNCVFSYFFCVLEFEGDPDFEVGPETNDRAWMLKTIQNGCLNASLIGLRDLDDILKGSSSRSDDLRVLHFGNPEGYGFLTKSEREQINKMIAHTTTTAAFRRPFRWDIYELTTKGVTQALQFLHWIEATYFPGEHFLLYTAALVCRKKTDSIWKYLQSQLGQ